MLDESDEDKMSEFRRIKAQDIVRDKDGLEVYLAISVHAEHGDSEFSEITFHTSEFKLH